MDDDAKPSRDLTPAPSDAGAPPEEVPEAKSVLDARSVSMEDQAAIRAAEEAARRDPDAATPVPQSKPFPRKATRDGRLTYGQNNLALAEALTGQRGERAIQVLDGIVTALYGNAQDVLDSVPDELPDWARG